MSDVALTSLVKAVDVLRHRRAGITVPGFEKYTTRQLATFVARFAADVLGEEVDAEREAE